VFIIRIGAIVGAAISLIGPTLSYAQESGCKPKQYAELAVTYSPGGGVILPVTIDGKPENMVLDLSFPYVVISPAVISELGLKVFHASAVFNLGGRPSNSFTKVSDLRIGGVSYPGWDLLINTGQDASETPEPGEPIGSIGWELFHYFDLELDLGHDKVRIFSDQHCRGVPPVYWTHSYSELALRPSPLKTLYFVMQADGKNLETTLAANSNTTLIFAEVTKVAYGWDETTSEQGYRTMSLSSPGLKITDARVRVVRLNRCSLIGLDRDGAYRFSDCFGIHPLKLGVDVLKKVRIYMAVKAERMYISAWDAQ